MSEDIDFSFLSESIFEPLRTQGEINSKAFRTLALDDTSPETNWVRVQYAYELMRDNIHGANVFPGAVAAILRSRAWEGYDFRGEIIKTTFREFVQAQPPKGLGTTVEDLIRLCKKYPAVVEVIDQVLKEDASHGGKSKKDDIAVYNIHSNNDAISKRPAGTSLQRSLRQLRSLAETDSDARSLRDQVLRGEMSASRALKQLGKQKIRYGVQATPESIVNFIKKHLNADQIRNIIDELTI